MRAEIGRQMAGRCGGDRGRGESERELGIDLRPRDQPDTQAAIFRDLKLERDQHPLEPLFHGEWR